MSSEAFRQVDEKHVSSEVDHMLWSPKIDLVALSNVQGEVILHRLSWQKVWTLAPPEEGETVGGLAWRPDGKVLAVGYASGKIRLCDIENAEVLHNINMSKRITTLNWISQVFTGSDSWSTEPYSEDGASDFLPKLQPLNKSYGTISKGHQEENVEDSKKLKDQKELNLLLVGTDGDMLHTFAYGIFPTAEVSVSVLDGSEIRRICSASISQDLHCLSLIVESRSEQSDDIDYYMLTYDTMLLASRHKELRLLALKYGQITTLIGYLQLTIQQMSEAWEDILMTMDTKLLTFAEQKQRSLSGEMTTVSNDFLELLLFGTLSPELQHFLEHELTEKRLKKLGHSIETSYSNIQKLVVKHLQSVSQAIVYHLSDLGGMSLWYDKFGVLGLDTAMLQKAVDMAGSFVITTSQLQQVIDGSIKNFKAFFRWLYVVILRLSNQQPPAELSKMTQHDVNFVAEFLKENFVELSPTESAKKNHGFKLEKVGQYLKKKDLLYPPDTSNNPWVQYLNSSTLHKDNDVLYPVDHNKSLIQIQDSLETIIEEALKTPATVIGQSLICVCTHHLFTLNRSEGAKSRSPVFCQFMHNESKMLYTVFAADFMPSDSFFILRQPTDSKRATEDSEIIRIVVGQLGRSDINTSNTSDSERCSHHQVLDVAVYDEHTLCVMLQEDRDDGNPVLIQLPLSILAGVPYTRLKTTENVTSLPNIKQIDVGPLLNEHNYRHLENMKAHSFAVSGTRKTATVLFSSRRRVRIFLMDAEEEDEEDQTLDESEIAGTGTLDESQSETGVNDSQPMEEGDEDKENSSSLIGSDGEH
ncbi:anaphase-promoting complex subunit 4-like [Gigantopelta aegis]|uniref:anaphase-promoting complex subunit 4-like n=1 Tax=Gigantopelta aegis TaxID=1735272 RepID=UPI001B88C11C|nr:anaphase-promoting complex subunit 4-like [Gigantopelta aegis]XP_041370962.1 anaphase-promoting complex subunit 4-like [Gigantopelta aegis]